jgi:pyridine nucleotide-disulfide oxidoreductase family protein
MKRLLLVGGGHAQLAVLQALARQRPRGVEAILLTPSPWQWYSGMLPGWMAGHYRAEDCRIDLRPLAAAAGVRLCLGAAVALDADRRRLQDDSDATHDFDLLSLDVGSLVDARALEALPAGTLLPVKPLQAFFAAWPQRLASARASQLRRLAVVGGGAAGVELVLAAAQAFRGAGCTVALTLVAPPGGLLAGHAEGVRRRVERRLAQAGIALHLARAEGTAAGLVLDHGAGDAPAALPADCVIAATGARALPWLRESGLACDAEGWVAVDAGHRSVSHPFIHAAGDVCTRATPGFTRSGVHAVHAGPVLAANLLASVDGVAEGEPRRSYLPRTRSLYLIATGPRHAIASWGRWSAEGRWVWHWKDYLDRGFIARHRCAAIMPV